MTNVALQAMIDQFGIRINVIIFDNTQVLFLGYGDTSTVGNKVKVPYIGVTIDDLSLETIGDIDFVVISQRSRHKDGAGEYITYKAYHPTEYIQDVIVIDEPFVDYRLDPMNFT